MRDTAWERPFPTKFRRRLAVFCAASVAVATGLFGAGSFLFIRHDKLERFEANARREARIQLMKATARPREDLQELARELTTGGQAQVVLVGEAVASSHERLGPPDVPDALRDNAPAGLPAAMTDRPHGSFLVIAGRVPTTSATAYFFFDHRDVAHDITMVARVLAVAWIIVIAVSTGLCYRLARQALWPVRRAADAATDLANGLLRTRLPVEGDDEFAAWAQSFNHMVDELERRIAREQRFTADVAHELRTPLASLVTAASMLDANLDSLPPAARRPAELIVQELRRLRQLVEDLLEVSGLESGHDPVVVTDVELRERVRQLLLSRGWGDRVRLEGPHVRVATDPRRIDRVVENLVDNAVRHGRDPVVVTVRPTPDEVLVEVCDAGAGMPAGEVPRLFEPFFKRDPSRRGPGSGLGLAIAAEHARLLGGRVVVTSDPGQRTCFALVVPRRSDLGSEVSDVPGEAAPPRAGGGDAT